MLLVVHTTGPIASKRRLLNNEVERMRKEKTVAEYQALHNICVEHMKKTTNILNQPIMEPGSESEDCEIHDLIPVH